MGTMLEAAGVPIGRCYEELNLAEPELVKGIHQAYVNSGAEVIRTNTFGANPQRLDAFGLGGQLRAIIQAGVQLACQTAGENTYVAGTIGPLGPFREQIQALVENGVDLLMLETFYKLEELREAVFAARELAPRGMAIVAHVTVGPDGNLPDGTDAGRFTDCLEHWPADVIGCNCSVGPDAMLATIENMRSRSRKPLGAMPSAGLPEQVNGRSVYPCSPASMSQHVQRFLASGVRLLGGCCGTTPEHIRLLRREMDAVRITQKE